MTLTFADSIGGLRTIKFKDSKTAKWDLELLPLEWRASIKTSDAVMLS